MQVLNQLLEINCQDGNRRKRRLLGGHVLRENVDTAISIWSVVASNLVGIRRGSYIDRPVWTGKRWCTAVNGTVGID